MFSKVICSVNGKNKKNMDINTATNKNFTRHLSAGGGSSNVTDPNAPPPPRPRGCA